MAKHLGAKFNFAWYSLKPLALKDDNTEYSTNCSFSASKMRNHPIILLTINMRRKPGRYVRELLLPTTLFVIASWVSDEVGNFLTLGVDKSVRILS